MLSGSKIKNVAFKLLVFFCKSQPYLLRTCRHAVVIKFNQLFPLVVIEENLENEKAFRTQNAKVVTYMTNKRLPTGGVGSYVQPLWLVNQDILHFIVQRIGAPLKIISVESLITVPNCDMKNFKTHHSI